MYFRVVKGPYWIVYTKCLAYQILKKNAFLLCPSHFLSKRTQVGANVEGISPEPKKPLLSASLQVTVEAERGILTTELDSDVTYLQILVFPLPS